MAPSEPDPPRHIVVVERDVIVGMDLAEDLAEMGYRVSGPFASSRDVDEFLAEERPDLAIVDTGLRDGTGLEAAMALHGRQVRMVVFASGSHLSRLDGELKDVPWVEKPASIERLLKELGETRPGVRPAT